MRIYILLSLFTVAYNIVAVAQNNFRFADSTAHWNTLEFQLFFGAPPTYANISYTAQKDTAIAGLQYQKISCSTNQNFFFRQDSLAKVYVRRTEDTADYLIYDFSKATGDTFIIKNIEFTFSDRIIRVDSVDSVMLGNKLRKRMYITAEWSPDVWIEGIGSVYTLLWSPGVQWDFVDGPGRHLLCFYEAGQKIFQNENYDSCYVNPILAIEEREHPNFRVFPVPVTENYIYVETNYNLNDNTTFQLFDIEGRLVLKQEVAGLSKVYLTDVPKGVYLCNIINEGLPSSFIKVVVY